MPHTCTQICESGPINSYVFVVSTRSWGEVGCFLRGEAFAQWGNTEELLDYAAPWSLELPMAWPNFPWMDRMLERAHRFGIGKTSLPW